MIVRKIQISQIFNRFDIHKIWYIPYFIVRKVQSLQKGQWNKVLYFLNSIISEDQLLDGLFALKQGNMA